MNHDFSTPHFPADIQAVIDSENLLPKGLMSRLHRAYPGHSGLVTTGEFFFKDRQQYSGLSGFRKVVEILASHGIDIGYIREREFFIEVYRFMATKHVLNAINWKNFENDSLFQLVIPQPGMIKASAVKIYLEAKSDEERRTIVADYMKETNPHDGKQKLNRPWFINEDGELQFVEGSQHKYPQCQLIFDKAAQNCFAFCTYCFRHAQVRGDEDMFVQDDISQVHAYLREHKEVTDILITGGDSGFITPERFAAYIDPLISDPQLLHIKTVRLGTRVLTFHPELILSEKYKPMLEMFTKLRDNGIQPAFMSHFSTPREILNPATIAAVRRLQNHGAILRSQSPIMNHISLFTKDDGKVDVDKTAQNWIDLGNILGMLSIGFHSIYCARPTGEHHYFSVPLAELDTVFRKIYRSLASISRPTRHISMTSSAGKISILGTAEVNGEKTFALAFTEGRNMEWLDKVFLAKYDEKQNTIVNLQPLEGGRFFFEDELEQIEIDLEEKLKKRLS